MPRAAGQRQQSARNVLVRVLISLLLGAAAIAARLPFLLSGKIPFDSDEAVEGLMARHVLNGELPAFFWGQAYKGVPEVYLAAGLFAAFDSSVILLKSVTLACFAAFVAANFLLIDKIAPRTVAVSSSLLLIFAPPALVLWSLSANAEYIFIMLLGTILLLLGTDVEAAGHRGRREAGTRGRLFAAGVITGIGMWVHPLFVAYVGPLLAIAAVRTGVHRRMFVRVSMPALLIGIGAAIYLLLAITAFFTGGFTVRLGPLHVSATSPQKMMQIAVAISACAIVVQFLARSNRDVRASVTPYWPIAAGLLIGYAPALLYSAAVEVARSPLRSTNLQQSLAAAPDIFGNILPILAGFKIPTTERLPLPVIAALPGIAALVAYMWRNRVRLWGAMSIARDFFPLFVLIIPALFIVGGVYLDAQSYRYLVPWYAGLAVAWSAGSFALAGNRWPIAAAIVAAIAGIHVWQQVIWYGKLSPDAESLAIIDCLKQDGIRGGSADYWTSYKLTFLARETVIIVPDNGVDRYPPYTEFVHSLPAHQRVVLGAANAGSACVP